MLNLGIQSGLLFIFGAKKSFIKLSQVFVEAPILNHFDPKRHIQIKIDVLGYGINKIFSHLTSNDLSQ